MQQISFSGCMGSVRTRLGAYSAPRTTLAGLRTLLVRGWEGSRGKKKKDKRRVGRGQETRNRKRKERE